jgi:1-deoxy-D-xylulose-5-phosphate reductoisomerase
MTRAFHNPQSYLLHQPKTVSVMGSTGSIGTHTIALIQANPQRYQAVVLTAQNNVQKLIEQALALRPKLVVIGNSDKFLELKQGLAGTGIETAAGEQAVIDAADYPSDVVVEGIVGAAGLASTLRAIRRGATVALANKESLVCAGELIRNEMRKSGAVLLPVDSEHNAIFQIFDFEHPELVDKLILTASGGPFRQFTSEQMAGITPEMAVKHPNWSMGAKISVDSATMMNKGLEMIEAYHLFPIKAHQIEVLVHPESIVHSMVEYRDGSVLAQMGVSDMTIPIAYALAWPLRIKTAVPKLNFAQIGSLHFEAPDEIRFPALRLAREALTAGNASQITFNAANEVAVDAFLNHRIPFLRIAALVEETLSKMAAYSFPIASLNDILALDKEVRHTTSQQIVAEKFLNAA